MSRPCIDSADETYNCEWSQELKLEDSFREYLNAWVLLHALAHKLGLPDPGTHFNMSVGYNLEGIQSPRVQAFIAAMRDAGPALHDAVDRVAKVYPAVRDLAIPAELSNHITLSTMHGCPPAEIERIAGYLLTGPGRAHLGQAQPDPAGPRAAARPAEPDPGLRHRGAGRGLRPRPQVRGGHGHGQEPGRPGPGPAQRLRPQALQHPGGGEPPAGVPGQREDDVPVRAGPCTP